MANNINWFPELELSIIKGRALIWARRYPFIDKIILYRGVEEDKPFVLELELNEKTDPSRPEFHKFFTRWGFWWNLLPRSCMN